MNQQPTGIAAVLARAWQAVVTAFTPTRKGSGAHGDEAETTLFSHLQERNPPPAARDRRERHDWGQGSESTDFGDVDPERRR